MKQWYDDYKNLDLLQGKIELILEYYQDMIEKVYYNDGMLIDIGYINEMKSYYDTVVFDRIIENNTFDYFKYNKFRSLYFKFAKNFK